MGSTPFITDVAAVSPGRQIGLDIQHAAPPTAAYMGVDDQLLLMVSTSRALGNTVQVNARLLMPDGSIVPNTWLKTFPVGRAAQLLVLPLPECFILSMAVSTGGGQGILDCFVEMQVVRGGAQGGFVHQVLCSGYPQGSTQISWPSGVSTDNVNCVGNIRSITGTTPGATADISETVPLNAKWRLISFIFSLTTDATVGSRFARLTIDDGTNIIAQIGAGNAQTASNTFVYNFANGYAGVLGAATNLLAYQMPTNMFLMPGYRIRTAFNLLGFDQFTAPQYQVEEWLLP